MRFYSIKKLVHSKMLHIACSIALAGGCAAPQYTDYNAFINDPMQLVSSEEYRVAPPDTIAISSKRVREVSNLREQIRPDGRINLPLLGSIFVAGKTCEELSVELSSLAREYYEDADITVHVIGFASKKIFIFGEVSGPGSYSYNGTNTVLNMLAKSQPTRLADPTRIQVLRPDADGNMRKRMTVDLNKMVKEGDTSLNALLEEGDVIYVPPNPLASVGLAFQQLLLPLQPAASTVKGPSDIYNSTQTSVYGNNQ
ncbi:Polysaccharide biosynthesis/export protein [Poriferisphaera corsica]|uniref:Polysaccharide biosynthesis/export protein n=1 Tax=Poriferisphaera corsica TaxID=2528020 RepID=A0A517YV22_9BACT|nr:polysaccharide biosynthesis/export family protein [Poriferisphaera corsica]QDU34002.1 Polysaccharide biosynthesis/export protein [Poriferisphaera corsica]